MWYKIQHTATPGISQSTARPHISYVLFHYTPSIKDILF